MQRSVQSVQGVAPRFESFVCLKAVGSSHGRNSVHEVATAPRSILSDILLSVWVKRAALIIDLLTLLITSFVPLCLLRPSTLQENTHRLTLSMNPEEAYMEKQVKAEEEKLGRKVQALTDADRKEIYEKGGKTGSKEPTCGGFEEFAPLQQLVLLDPGVLLLQRSGAAGCPEPNSGRFLFTCPSSI